MERTQLASLCGLALGISYLASQYRTSLAFTRPVPSAILTLALLGGLVVLADRHRLFNVHIQLAGSPTRAAYLQVPSPGHSPRPSEELNHPSFSRWRTRAAAALLVLSSTLRVLVLHLSFQQTHRPFFTIEVFLPLLLGIYDLCINRRSAFESRGARLEPGRGRSRASTVWRNCQDGRYTFVITSACFGFSAAFVFSGESLPQSTYLHVSGTWGVINAAGLQVLALLLDGGSLVAISEIIEMSSQSRARDARMKSVGLAFLFSSMLLGTGACIWVLFDLRHRLWAASPFFAYVTNSLKFALAVAITCCCALHLASKAGLLETTTLVAYLSVSMSSWVSGAISRSSFTALDESPVVFGLFLATAALLCALDALWIPQDPDRYTTGFSKRIRFVLLSVGIFLVVARSCLALGHQPDIPYHPIDNLIDVAGKRHKDWEKSVQGIDTLDMVIVDYRTRYGRNPPPNFDKWYEYATARESKYLCDFDNIYNDILPFWSLRAQDIRRRTAIDISQEGNGVGGIVIRQGHASIGLGVPPDHAWMLEGVIEMMKNFVQYLPDMDLAFNLNDEPRVMVRYEEYNTILQRATMAFRAPTFSPHRNSFTTRVWLADDWKDIDERTAPPYSQTEAFQPIYHKYASAHCPPRSPARSSYPWNTRELCVQCLRFHSHPLGPFPISQAAASDICYQPDLSYLHGFYAAPSTSVPAFDLRPTFSQSKAAGFRDIMFPSPWNYLNHDNTAYEPTDSLPDGPFTEKKNTLFWRGATSEGFAASDGRRAWQGMMRQRFVALANFPQEQNVLLPDHLLPDGSSRNPDGKEEWSYHRLSPSQLTTYFSTDVSIVHPITRCVRDDCDVQDVFFNTTMTPDPDAAPASSSTSEKAHNALTDDRMPFQSHWRYRFLFDTDGAAFSGRFLPFLRSRSLPIKTTGLFKEWWDGRVVPWWHYVPVDNRLVGLYSTLAYFGGMRGGSWKGRPEQAEAIAERGRAWAEKVLRKEDMEIYMFRLLLEWGRVIDNERSMLGLRCERLLGVAD